MLTDYEQVDVRRHTGYLNVQQAQTFNMGVPAAVQTQFIIEGAMQRLLPAAEKMCRRYLDILNGIEEQLLEDQGNLAAEKFGTITINRQEFEDVMKQYKFWQGNLCNLLGVQPNPFDQRPLFGVNGGGVNVNVNH